MNELELLFAQASQLVNTLGTALERRTFPTPQEIQALEGALQNLQASQKHWEAEVIRLGGQPDAFRSAEELSALLKTLEQRKVLLDKGKRIVSAFLSIQPKDASYRAELEQLQTEARTLQESQLMDPTMQPMLEQYQTFTDCVRNPPVPQDLALSLVGRFGYKLGFALLTGGLVWNGAAEQAAPESPAPAEAAPASAAAEPAEEEKPMKEPEPTAEAKQVMEAKPKEEPKSAEQTAPVEEAKPAEQPKAEAEPKPAEQAAPVEEAKPAEQPKAEAEPKPAEQAAPVEEAKPAEQPKAEAEPKPAEQAAPVEEAKPAEQPKAEAEPRPAEQTAPAEEAKPAEPAKPAPAARKAPSKTAARKKAATAVSDSGEEAPVPAEAPPAPAAQEPVPEAAPEKPKSKSRSKGTRKGKAAAAQDAPASESPQPAQASPAQALDKPETAQPPVPEEPAPKAEVSRAEAPASKAEEPVPAAEASAVPEVSQPATAPKADAAAARPNLPERITSTQPVKKAKRDASPEVFRSDMRKMVQETRVLLPALSQYGVLDKPLLSQISELYRWSRFQISGEIFNRCMEKALETAIAKSYVAEYACDGFGPVYCLTEFGYTALRKPAIMRNPSTALEISTKDENFCLDIGSNAVCGTNEMDTAVLANMLDRNRTIVSFLQFARDIQGIKLTKDGSTPEVAWESVWQTYRISMPNPFGDGYVPCYVCTSFDEYPGFGAVLFLLQELPDLKGAGADATYCWIPGGLYLWGNDGWKLTGTRKPASKGKPIPPATQTDVPQPIMQSASSGMIQMDTPQQSSRKRTSAKKAEEADAAPAAEPAAPAQTPEAPAEAQETQPEPAPAEPPAPVVPVQAVREFQDCTVQEIAQKLLEHPKDIKTGQLLELAVHLIAENRMAEASAVLETSVSSPGADPRVAPFYLAFQQSVQVPGQTYRYNSGAINAQQTALPDDDPDLQALQQTLVLSNLLWAMAFPTDAYDHDLYNNAKMALGTGDSPAVSRLTSLLSQDLKALSFQGDGLGFSPAVVNSLLNSDEREKQIQEVSRKAASLLRTPTSTISIHGLETCLKLMVGPTSILGKAVKAVADNQRSRAAEVRKSLEAELGTDSRNLSVAIDEFIRRSWDAVRKQDQQILIRSLINESPAHKACRKAVSERLDVIHQWLEEVEAEHAGTDAHRNQYAKLLNQLQSALGDLLHELEEAPVQDTFAAARAAILRRTAQKMQVALTGKHNEDGYSFWQPLWLNPELLLEETGEPAFLNELYQLPGMEPWITLLQGMTAPPADPHAILESIGEYTSVWYRNYGADTLLRTYLGEDIPDRMKGIANAESAMQQDVEVFKSDARLQRAYGKIEEHSMETAFTLVDLAQQAYSRCRCYAGFTRFLDRMRALRDEEIEARAQQYQQRLQELEQNPAYAQAPLLEVIRRQVESRCFTSADTYINLLQNGESSLPLSQAALDPSENFLAQFLSSSEALYRCCQRGDNRSSAPAKWAETELNNLGEDHIHWSSEDEQAKGIRWLTHWPLGRGDKSNLLKIQGLLTGLGFQVKSVEPAESDNRDGYDLFRIHAEATSSNLTDYPHPVYKYGTDLSDPMWVVCLYGCKGAATLINTMVHKVRRNGPTIVLMDGSLSAGERQSLAGKFKADTSGQFPFLLIDRVLLLYLASLDEGFRQKAMFRCTLPYTYEVLYGTGSGAVPEEMFIGRESELKALRSEFGPNLVFGGRQLGKTALLNRVSKTLHSPEDKDYSFCVDIKGEDAKGLLAKLNKQLQRLQLISAPCTSLKNLSETLITAYEDKQIRNLRIFVDEVDHLFEEFRLKNYEPLRPFITVRDKTLQHIKFVFAGTHDVAAADGAEAANSSLIHMRPSLCIQPLTPGDATKLIRIPMSYLGFEIGDAQIELILTNTNSYPGLIHMFCSALVQSVCRDYGIYYGDNRDPLRNPPYTVSDEQMRAVFKETDIRKEIGTRVMSTITLNDKYRIISCLLAYKIYEGQNQGASSLFGYTPKDLLECNARDFQNPILDMPEQSLTALMDEMEKMGILWKKQGTSEYRFRQQDFLSYIGDENKVIGALLGEPMSN